MLQKRTLHETYYAINTALNTYLKDNGVKCSVYKYGIDPATLKAQYKDSTKIRYPYIQASMTNVKQQSWTSKDSGIFTDFDYQLSFFTAPPSELVNDSKYFYPFEIAKNAISDIQLNLLGDIASIISTTGPLSFSVKSGVSVPSAIMIYRMRAICAYQAIVPDKGETTDFDSGIRLEYTE